MFHHVLVIPDWLCDQKCSWWQLNLTKSFYQIYFREKKAVNFMVSVKCAAATQDTAKTNE